MVAILYNSNDFGDLGSYIKLAAFDFPFQRRPQSPGELDLAHFIVPEAPHFLDIPLSGPALSDLGLQLLGSLAARLRLKRQDGLSDLFVIEVSKLVTALVPRPD